MERNGEQWIEAELPGMAMGGWGGVAEWPGYMKTGLESGRRAGTK